MEQKIRTKKLKKYFLTAKQGFSIGEVMLSTLVLTVGMVAVIGLISSSINHSTSSRDQIVASELAQEGIELVRNVRDNNQAQIIKETAGGGSPSTDAFKYFPSDKDDCKIDKNFNYSSGGDIECGISDFNLKANDFYEHSGVKASKFSRRIKIKDFNSGKGKKITSIVTWNKTNPSSNTGSCEATSKCVWVETILTERY